MKKQIILRLLQLSLCVLPAMAHAQQKKLWEHNIYQGIGMVKSGFSFDHQTIALHVGYGFSYTIAPRWSIMPGVGLRIKAFRHDDRSKVNCASTYMDIPLLLQYHFSKNREKGVMVQCGPVVSFRMHTGTHKYQFIKGEDMFRKFDFAVQPGVYYELKNWRFGVQSHIGLIDTKSKYPKPYDFEHGFGQYDLSYYDDPDLTKSYFSLDVVATICYHW